MSVKAVIHARMERISETRNTTCFGAFKVGMLPPVKRLGLGLQSGSFWLLAVKLALTQARPWQAGTIRRSSPISMLGSLRTMNDEREATLEERMDTLCYARCLRLVLRVSFLRAGPQLLKRHPSCRCHRCDR
jgi:hypothetical protein